MTSSALFVCNRQQLSYQNRAALHDINLQIHSGEKVALIGASGSGKSSLLRLLYAQQRNNTALCPQQPGLVPMLSVFHNIYMGRLDTYSLLKNLRTLLIPAAQDLAEIGELALELGLKDKLRTSIDRLSGGQMQRAALGRAIYQKRPVFMGDEPLSSLDPMQGARLLHLLNQRHNTVVIALHNRQLALEGFDRVIGLKAGRIVLDAPSETLTLQNLDGVYAHE